MARFTLVAFLLAEIYASYYGFNMASHYPHELWCHQYVGRLLLPISMLLVFFPVTCVFLVSTFCQTNEKDELLPDSLVAKLAMRLSKNTRETGEVQYCPTFWNSIVYLALFWVMAGLGVMACSKVDPASCKISDLWPIFISCVQIVGIIVSYVLGAFGITSLIHKYAGWRTNDTYKPIVVTFPAILFFTLWAAVWFSLFVVVDDLTCYRNVYLSFRDSFALSVCFAWIFALVAWLMFLWDVLWESVKQSLVSGYLAALKNRVCPRVKIASK